MKMPLITPLNIPSLMSVASKLTPIGTLAISANNLTYLNVDDDYIYRCFPLLQNKHIQKPAYFGYGLAGAHISVIYPEENKSISEKELDQQHHFKIKDLVTAKLELKTYYALRIESPSLLQLRRNHDLSDMLCFNNYLIDFHITIGVMSF